MQIKRILLTSATALMLFGFSACKKSSSNSTNETAEKEAAIQASKDGAESDAFTEDANGNFEDAAASTGNLGNSKVEASNLPGCVQVSVTGNFPNRVITMDFGTGCTDLHGVTRRGKIVTTLTDTLRRPGSIATMTFVDYYVSPGGQFSGEFHHEGTVKWTNTTTGVPGTITFARSWTREAINVKTTAPDGHYIVRNGTKTVVQTGGYSTPIDRSDDVFSIIGNHTITTSNGRTFLNTITTALEKKNSCRWIDQGVASIVRTNATGNSHTVVLDYGAGTCDNLATVSIDGGAATTITLP
jgi:hypothetical protein